MRRVAPGSGWRSARVPPRHTDSWPAVRTPVGDSGWGHTPGAAAHRAAGPWDKIRIKLGWFLDGGNVLLLVGPLVSVGWCITGQ